MYHAELVGLVGSDPYRGWTMTNYCWYCFACGCIYMLVSKKFFGRKDNELQVARNLITERCDYCGSDEGMMADMTGIDHAIEEECLNEALKNFRDGNYTF